MSSSRLLAGAVAGAVATALVTVAPAGAGTGSTTYDCTFPVLGTLPVPVTTTIPDLPAVPAGSPVPAGSLDPSFVFDATSLGGVLALVSNPSASGLGLSAGAVPIPLNGFSFGSLSGTSLPGSASSGAFTAPAVPGSYPISMPSSFDFTGLLSGSPVSVPCVTDLPASLGNLVVSGDSPVALPSTTEASVAKKKIRKGKRAKVIVSVVDELSQAASGKVVVRKGKKAVGRGSLTDGATTIRTTKLRKPGRYRLTVKYLGAELTEASKDTVVVRVVRRR